MQFVQVAGRLGSDPETRVTPSGQKVTSFRMATNTRRAGKEETTWWRVTIWGDRFDKMLPYLKKGSGVMVFGELRAEIYTDKNGQPQISLEVTAETIKFNPFGGGSGEKVAGAGGTETPAEQAHSNMGGAAYGDAYAPAAKTNGYHGGSTSTAGQGSGRPTQDLEEDLPF